jgi:hypothetical protein
MTPLRQWWLALAELPGQLAVEAEWQRRLGTDLAPLKPFMGPTKQRAQSLPRDDGRDGPRLRVVPGAPAVVIDDLTGAKREVKDSELILRQAKPAAMAKALHEGLQLDGAVGMTPQNGFCWDLGQAAVSDSEFVPVVLAITTEEDLLADALRDLAMANPDGSIVLLPSIRQVTSELKTRLEHHRCQLLDCSQCIALGRDGKRLVMIGGPQEVVTAQRRWRNLVVDCECLFDIRREGEHWLLIWNGHTLPMKDMVGLHYVRALIQRRRSGPIHCIDLKAQIDNVDRNILDDSAGIDVTTQEAIDSEETEKQRLLDSFNAAQRRGDDDVADKILEDLEALEKRRAEGVTIRGKPRKKSAAEAHRTSIHNAIKGTKSSVVLAIRNAAAQLVDHREDFEDLADHLQEHIHTGFMLAYRPRQEIPWSL